MPRIVTDDAPKAPSRGKRGGLSVTDLRKRLKALGLKVAGTKAELEARYQAAVATVEDASTPVEVSKRSLESEEDHKTVPSSPSHPSPKRHKVETLRGALVRTLKLSWQRSLKILSTRRWRKKRHCWTKTWLRKTWKV
eukprot:symbB.v1.2.032905.t1/scaffold4015.1/size46345/1